MAKLLYMQIAEDLMKQIHSGELTEGKKLSERKLAEEYKVSRTVVREAIKLLNEKGYVETLYGKGSYIRLPDEDMLMRRFREAVDVSKVEATEVLEARELLECTMAHMIVERISEKDMEILEELYQEMQNSKNEREYIDLDAKFHLAISMCAHNRVLSIMTGTLNQLTDREEFVGNPGSQEKASREHAVMLEALREHDEEKLLRALQTHIDCIRSYVEKE